MNNNNILWIQKYADLPHFEENWGRNLYEKYGEEMLQKYDEDISPIQFVNNDIENFATINVKDLPDKPEDESYTGTILLSLDTLKAFSNQIPASDNKLYQIYKKINNNDDFKSDFFDFPEFYVFCEKLRVMDITNLSVYENLNNNKSKNEKYISHGSIWKIKKHDEIYNVQIISESIDDEYKINAQITDKTQDEQQHEIGDFIEISKTELQQRLQP